MLSKFFPAGVCAFAVQYTLPLDLFAKGQLSFEVWDSDDTTSDFLGGADISLHLLWKEGQRDTRSLAVVRRRGAH